MSSDHTDEPGEDDRQDAADTGPTPDAHDDESDEGPPPGSMILRRETPFLAPPKRTGVFLDPDDLRVHVGGLLRTFLPGYEVDPLGNFTFKHDGARVFITVGPSPIGPQVGVFSVTNVEVDLSPDLATFLLTTNHRLAFGAFSYDPDSQSVWLRHTLLGTMLDGPELHSAVAAIATTAASVDDAIQKRFGGHTFLESSDDVQRATRPPEPSMDPANVTGYL